MKTLTLVLAGGLLATAASAQTTSTSPSQPTGPAVTTSPVVPTTPGAAVPTAPGTNTTGTVPGAGVIDRNTGPAAASGDTNQAVATTGANAPQPAKGANSFTDGEARRRLESSGYSSVADLKKDGDGVWRGSATKDGAKVGVWLDYKGNIGQQ